MSRDIDVIVVGGGFAGVTAAAECERLDPNARVLLLEADERVGGRTRVIPGPGGLAVDLGAHYYGVEHRRLAALAQRLLEPAEIYSHVPMYGDDPAFRSCLDDEWRLTTRSTSFFQIQGLSRKASWRDKVTMFGSLVRYLRLESLVDVGEPWRTPSARALDAQTVRDWIDAQALPRWIADMWGLATLDIMSIPAERLSLLYWLWYNAANGGFVQVANDFTGGPQEFGVDPGLGGLLERYAGTLRGSVRTATPVVAVDHSEPDGIVVTTASGEQIAAGHVVVAASAATVGRRIEFTPPLQPLRRRMFEQPVGHAVKAVLFYEAPFWRDSHGGHHFIGYSGGPRATGIEWALDGSHPSGAQYALMTFVSPALVDRGGDVEAALRDAAAEMSGDERARATTHIELYDWRANEWVGGGPDAFMGPGLLSELDGVLGAPEPPHRRLWFAGAEQSTEFPGYVEGAMASGERAAAGIAAAPASERRRGPRRARAAALSVAAAALAPAGWLAR